MPIHFPPLSIIIVTLNAQRTIKECLKYIQKQNYPNISEVLIIDGGSTDATLSVAKKSKLPIKIIHGGYKNNQEARRAVGLLKTKNEYCVFIDADNFLLDKNLLTDMVTPLLENKDVVASQTLRYAAPKNTTVFNRYFGLLGAGDPVAYYLKKADRLSWAFDNWNLKGKVIAEKKKYFIVDFDPNDYPTVGCNGIVFKKSLLLKSKWGKPENYVHTDVFVDIAKLGYTKFAIVKDEIFHNTADTIWNFFKKRRGYMGVYHQKLHATRRHLVFDKNKKEDIFHLLLFILFAITIIEPLYESVRGYLKKPDRAWFLHPVVSLGIALVYAEATIASSLSL